MPAYRSGWFRQFSGVTYVMMRIHSLKLAVSFLVAALVILSRAQAVEPATTTLVAPAKVNPIELEQKFQLAYSKIEERYIDRIQSVTLMIHGFWEMQKLPGMEGIKYADLVSPTQRLGSRNDDFQAFRKAIQTIRNRTGGKVQLDDLVSAMIRGMVRALADTHKDGYSAYLEPEKNLELVAYLKGESNSFGGIGVQIQFKDGQCNVIRPLPNTPAYRAGIRPGDIVVMVDGVEIKTEEEAVDRMKGEPGSRVAITISRADVPEPLTYQLIRQNIVQPESQKTMLTEEVGYVRLNSFNEHSSQELIENLNYLSGLGMKNCVLDLRQNSGGLLKASVDISEIFLPRGSLVVSTKGRIAGDAREYRTREGSPFARTPLIILVDGYTASAAEIVTGAIRDNRRGKVVGSSTFGKGTVQEVIPLPDDSALKLTVARYYTPIGESIDKTGIRPDYLVESTPDQMRNPAVSKNESTQADLVAVAEDPQIRKALELFGITIPLRGT